MGKKSKARFEERVKNFNEKNGNLVAMSLGEVSFKIPSDSLIGSSAEFPDSDDSGFNAFASEVKVDSGLNLYLMSCWVARQMADSSNVFNSEEDEFFGVVFRNFAEGLRIGETERTYRWLSNMGKVSTLSPQVMLSTTGQVFSSSSVDRIVRFFVNLEDLRVYVKRCGLDRAVAA